MLIGDGLHALWIHPIAVVLSTMDKRHSLSYSVSSTISIHIYISSSQNSNKLICVRPKYFLGVYHLYAITFELKPTIPIFRRM